MSPRTGVCAVVLVIACHAQVRSGPPDQRAAAAIAVWADALRTGAAATGEDRAGQFAILYGGAKLAASHVDGGAEAVERSVRDSLVYLGLQTLWPEVFGPPDHVYAVVPTGPLGPALVAAGLATQPSPGDPSLAIVPIPYDESIGRIERAHAAHRARLRERAAWTCRFERIERTVPPSEPSLRRAAQISPHMLGGWLRGIDGVWLAHARCAHGPARFAITAYRDRPAEILFAVM